MPSRIPLRYLLFGILILVGVVPLYFFGDKVVSINRERLKTNEQLLQNTVTKSLGDEVEQRYKGLQTAIANLSTAVIVTSNSNLGDDNVSLPELRKLLESFASSNNTISYAEIVNMDGRGISAPPMIPDVILEREMQHAFATARDGRVYNGQAITIGSGKNQRTVLLTATPISSGGRVIGIIGAVLDLDFLLQRLRNASQGGLEAFIVDREGRLVAGANNQYATGQDMRENELVRTFVLQGRGSSLFVPTQEFTIADGKQRVPMLGTYSFVPSFEWAVVVQKSQENAYRSISEMQQTATLFAGLVIALSLLFGIYAARQVSTPLQTLTESSRAIARGDFSRRVNVRSRTEIGELAQTFNVMTDDLERLVFDLKKAAEENRNLFLSSIQMLAGAVDEKDPYTRGHSDRVTRYSVIIAKELALLGEEQEKIRIAAQLHDVGKIGIEDRILKKPGALTPEEYEIMKTHTTKGASILRPVEMLKEMIPGIELHHESLDGRGYPHSLKGDAIPMIPRIIMVADTFDAMTTNRPYQAAMDAEYVIKIIKSLTNSKFDPRVVAAFSAVFERGDLRIHRAAVVSAEQAQAAAAGAGNGASSTSAASAAPAEPQLDNRS